MTHIGYGQLLQEYSSMSWFAGCVKVVLSVTSCQAILPCPCAQAVQAQRFLLEATQVNASRLLACHHEVQHSRSGCAVLFAREHSKMSLFIVFLRLQVQHCLVL
eukprot:6269859-Amphidinium_carterae.1